MSATQSLINKMLAEAFTGILSERPKIGQEISATDIRNLLPTVRITERGFGNVNNADREIIEKFTASLGGESTSVEDKLAKINDIIIGKEAENYGISQILTVMMVIEILHVILNQFTEAAGGFLFEGFLAGLFGGQSVQIESAEDIAKALGKDPQEARGKPITDVLLAGRNYSLKLLGASTAVQGSFSNMIKHFADEDHVVYLDARVTGGRTVMEFSEFEITLENFLDIFYEPFKKVTAVTNRSEPMKSRQEVLDFLANHPADAVRLSKTMVIKMNGETVVNAIKLPAEQFRKLFADEAMNATIEEFMAAKKPPRDIDEYYGPYVLESSGTEENFKGSVKAVKLFGTPEKLAQVRQDLEQYRSGKKTKAEVIEWLQTLPGAKNNEQFSFTPTQVEKIANHKVIGKLVVGNETAQKMWLQYGDVLVATIEPIYRNLNEFTRNINSFFLDAPKGGSRFEHGRMAMTDAKQLKDATNKVVSEQKGFILSGEERLEKAADINLHPGDYMTEKKNKNNKSNV